MIKSLVLALVTGAATLGAGAAHAGGVSWSIGIQAPLIGAVVSDSPYGYYAPAPVYYEPAPVYYERAPVYRAAPPVSYYPRRGYYAPEPVVYPRYYPGHAGYREHRHGGYRDRDGRWDHRGDGRWDRRGDSHWDRQHDGRGDRRP